MKRICLSVLVLLALLAAAGPLTAEASALDASVMKAALQAGTPQAQAFIDKVVAQVDNGTLPLDLVQSTFLWAKKKPTHKFFYFKQALILRAADLGIKL